MSRVSASRQLRRRSAFLIVSLLLTSAVAAQPPRPDQPRTVSMTLAEYNRLLALAARAPVPPVPAPVASVAAAADLRITIDRDTARGAFAITGQVLHNGIARCCTGDRTAERLGVARPDELAGQLSLLINGAFVSSQIFEPGEATPLLLRTAHALIEASRT